MTPTIVNCFPFHRNACPIADDDPPNCCRQNASLITITFSAPGASSDGLMVRPSCARTPSS